MIFYLVIRIVYYILFNLTSSFCYCGYGDYANISCVKDEKTVTKTLQTASSKAIAEVFLNVLCNYVGKGWSILVCSIVEENTFLRSSLNKITKDSENVGLVKELVQKTGDNLWSFPESSFKEANFEQVVNSKRSKVKWKSNK